MNDKRKVYVVAKGLHDWTLAAEYGEVVFLSTVPISRVAVSTMARLFAPQLQKSSPDDYLLITGLSVMCSIACSLFVLKHRRLNLLLFDAASEKYVKRTVVLDDIMNLEQVEQEISEATRPLA